MTALATVPEISKRLYTPDEYLERERTAAIRSQYVAGEIVPRAGASEEHNDIVVNIIALLRTQVRGQGGKVFTNDARIRTRGTFRYAYPDVVIFAGERIQDSVDRHSYINPTVIIEVLSDSTEKDDRVAKWHSYRRLESLQEYVLVDQYSPQAERFRRTTTDTWEYSVVSGLEGQVALESISCTLSLKDVYEAVDFGPAPQQGPELGT